MLEQIPSEYGRSRRRVRVVKVRASQVEPPPEEIVSARTDYVTGVAKREEGLLILLEPEKTLVVKP